jgi:hypothetical protein
VNHPVAAPRESALVTRTRPSLAVSDAFSISSYWTL